MSNRSIKEEREREGQTNKKRIVGRDFDGKIREFEEKTKKKLC